MRMGAPIVNLRKLHGQHRVIIRLASDLTGLAADLRTRDDAVEARLLLERLDRVLALHLDLEDRELYPTLAASHDVDVHGLAKDCVEEMGGLAQVWAGHLARWCVDGIHGDPSRFATATHALMEAVALRVDREERELYPLAERLEARAA